MERYGACKTCFGSGNQATGDLECGACGGTGFGGSIDDLENPLRIKNKMKDTIKINQDSLLDLAIHSIHTHLNKRKSSMSSLVVKESLPERFGFTQDQFDLIKKTVAKNATDDELELFFHRCKMLGLNPLMPGQIYFIKYGTSPGTIVVGIDGFRARAHATGKLSGVKRGVIRDNNGICTGAWADVYRSDWQEPAHEEVPLNEYHTGKGNWVKMPETMIKKVAEAAALRIAFPNDLGGLYLTEEMDQAEKQEKEFSQPKQVRAPSEPQLKRLFAISKQHGVTVDQMKDYLLTKFNKSTTKDLTIEEYNQICDDIQAGHLNTASEPVIEVSDSVEFEQPPIASGGLPWEKYMDVK